MYKLSQRCILTLHVAHLFVALHVLVRLLLSDKFGASSVSVITDFYSPNEIANMPLQDLINCLNDKGKNRFTDTENTAKLLQKATRDSYRLDKALYEPINLAIATSFNAISLYEKQLKELDKTILKTVKGLHSNEYDCLLSIKGIGPVFAAGIISEIGFISRFNCEEYLAHLAATKKYMSTQNNYKISEFKTNAFKNINITIHSGKWVMISKNTHPAIHFVIHHPKLRNAIENFTTPIIE